ncbi:TIGR04219 family outer membrane beta-barrel protein [Alteromonas sp. KUL49]|uniref:TIGR04219 family outer membrane beta-barrel protein n=1 Tax=Alteromonas sp. KUL49 TaxID=2480798 RepID=UPI00102F08C8|nr:TIGR04219 family outer membrane beta-barrel protein [Alteromonas sp. KUL49]TAP33359.1 TIGR04219 family outer membrane beta-barrel protein [Alteromonas sp. KUL49]GEA13738.1 outer membrane protein [Alteromonas sp. KUL49]
MKRNILAVVIGASLASGAAQADTIAGLYVGAQGWDSGVSGGFADTSTTSDFSFDDKTNSAIYVALEHPVPFVPNVKVNYTTMDTTGDTVLETNFTFNDQLFTASSTVNNDIELTSTDLILYYELFDNDLISFDLGINGKYIDGTLFVEDSASATSASADFSGVIPMVYSKVQLGLPFTGLAVYAEGSYLSFDDHEVSDYQVAATYSFIESLAIDMTLQLGYRNVTVDIEDLDDIYTNLTFDGVFAGLEVHF